MRSDSFQSERDLIDDLPEYRPINGLVVVAFILLLPSILGVFHPAFIAFSVVALLLAACSIWRTASGRGALRYGVGWIALGLAVLLTILPISLHYLNQRREYNFVIQSADRWLELLRGENPQEAYFLSLDPGARPEPGQENIDLSDASNRRMVAMGDTQEQFMSNPGVAVFADPRNSLTYIALAKRPASFLRKEYWITYRIHVPGPTPQDKIGIIEFMQQPDLGGPVHWQIGNCRLLE
jgi:hypothetical protein